MDPPHRAIVSYGVGLAERPRWKEDLGVPAAISHVFWAMKMEKMRAEQGIRAAGLEVEKHTMNPGMSAEALGHCQR